MMYYSTLLVFIICNPIVYGAKIIDRFGGFYRKDLPCKVWVAEGSEALDEIQAAPTFKYKTMVAPFKKLNCTCIGTKADEFGYPMDNGSYTGLIGMVQRRETDLLFIAVRPDSLPYEPALIGPMFVAADAAIISGKSKKNRVNREILAFVIDVDPLVYAYFCMSIIVFSVCYTISLFLSKENEGEDWDALTVGQDFLKTIWESSAALLDPENYSCRILTFFFTLGLFFGIYGIFLNNVGADLIRKNGPPNIDSIDYFANNITDTKPVIAKKLYLLNLLKSEPRNSTLGRIWSLMEKEQNETIFDVDKDRFLAGDQEYRMQTFARATDLLWEVQTRKKAIIMPRTIAENAKRVGCSINPVNVSRLYISKDSFASGTLNSLMSHGIHPSIRQIIEYFGRAFNEGGLVEGMAKITALDGADTISGVNAKLSLSALECVDDKLLTEMKDDPDLAAEVVQDDESFQQFSLFHLASLFKIWFIGLFAAFVLCIFEILYAYCRQLLHQHFFL